MDESLKKEIRNNFKQLSNLSQNNNLYSDFNYFKKEKLSINIDKQNTDINKSKDEGIKFRIFDSSKFIEYATTNLDMNLLENEFEKKLEQAKENFQLNNNKIELKINKDIIEKDFSNQIENSKENKLKIIKELSLEEKVDLLKKIRDDFLDYSNSIINVRVLLMESLEENIFVNKYKNLFQEIKEFNLISVIFVKSQDGAIRTVYTSLVSNSFDDVLNKFNLELNEFKEKINKVKKAKRLEGGKYKAILSPKLTGLLAHESFGHGMEADTMLKDRALASEYIGKKIGNDNINIVDFPNIEGKHGSFYFDHEGNLAKKTYLVKNGVINEPMADIYSKTKLDLKNSSNSRFESFDHKHYTRMSNTYFEAGNDNLDDMIKSIDDGIFIIDSSGGMEDPKGWGVQIQGNFGQRIKDGKLIDEYYDGFALTGFLPNLIKNISAISKEIEIEGGGSCGKGHKEWVRVSEGGPYIKIDEVILG